MEAANEDILLLRRYAQSGDARAFSTIVGRYQDFVYGTCLRVMGNAADAEDVAQECFLRLVRQAGSIKSSLGGWLHHCATDMSINEIRSQAARKNREEISSQMNSASNNDPAWHEMAPHVDKALDELPDELRIVIVEHFLRRRTQAELAKELGVSAMTVSRRAEAGIDQLRKKLKGAGVIVSAAALAALVSEHAVSAAPASLAAALGKMAVAGAGQAGAATATGAGAGWTGTGVAAGALAAAAKVKIIAAAVAIAAVVAAGAVVAHKMASREGQPPANGPAAVGQPEGEQPEKESGPAQAPAGRTLLSVLPREALAWCWVPSIEEVRARATEINPLVGVGRAENIGLPEDVFRRPCVIVLFPPEGPMPPDYLLGNRYFAALLTVDDIERVLEGFGEPDADGIYTTVGDQNGKSRHFFSYHGYVAFANRKDALRTLAVAGEKTTELSAEAKKMAENAHVFAHINVPRVLEALGPQIQRAREMIQTDVGVGGPEQKIKAGILKVALDLAAEVESFHCAVRFDEQDIKLMTATKVKEKSTIARYLIPSDGLGKLEPALPALDRFALAWWMAADEKLTETILADYQRIVAWALSIFPVEPAKAEALAHKLNPVVQSMKDFIGTRTCGVVNMTDGVLGLAYVAEIKKPEEFRAAMVKAVDTYNEILTEMFPVPGMSLKYVHEPDATTVAGVKVDRIRFEFTAEDPEIQAMIEEAMGIGGAEGLGYLFAIAGDKLLVALNEEDMIRALGAAGVPTSSRLRELADDPMIKVVTGKIGLDKDTILVLVPARLMELAIQLMAKASEQEGQAWTPLPYATPMAIGAKAVDGGIIRCDAYLPRACISEYAAVGLQIGITRAEDLAKRAKCMSNLRQIAQACRLYAEGQGEGKFFPRRLRDLVQPNLIPDIRVFRCPADQTHSTADLPTSYGCAFDLTDKRLTARMPIDLIILWDDEPRHGGKRCAAFADGHVKVLTEADFQKRIQALRAYLAELEAKE